jgi:homopolymeric O-antigen transport system permease protein
MSLVRSPVSLQGAAPAVSQPPAERERRAPLTVIQPGTGWQGFGVAELWSYRELLYFLVWRDVKVRYKQTVLGVAWAVIQPLFTMLIFTVVFGTIGGLDRRVQAPYPVFAYAGILLWAFFSGAVTQSAQSLIASSHLISKVYFPRLIIPIAAVGGELVDLGISCLMMFGLVLGYGLPLTARALLLPLFIGASLLAALGVGTLLSALTVAYRDFRYVTGFLIQTWMFVSPVAYPLEVIPPRWQLLYALNPMVGPISGCRSALLGEAFQWGPIAVSAAAAFLLFLLGTAYFRRVERRFADIV